MYKRLIDLHSHILPQLDDGARSIKQSLAMARACWADGISTVVATPHFYQDRSKGFLSKRISALQSLRKALEEADIPVEILPGFEVSGTVMLLNRPSLGSLTLAGTKWLLLERPYLYSDEFQQSIERVFDEDLRPLIAHPERYDYFIDDFAILEEYVSRGAWAQVTAAALAGEQGSRRRKWCFRAIELGLIHIVATDTHDVQRRSPRMQVAIQSVLEYFGEEMVQKLFYENPEKLLGRRSS